MSQYLTSRNNNLKAPVETYAERRGFFYARKATGVFIWRYNG